MKQPETKPAKTPAFRQLRKTKTWIIAKRRSNQVAQQRTNATVETNYMAIITKAKALLGKANHPIFERDYRNDTKESILIMHAFMCSSFYFLLECDPLYNYRIEYAFHNCPFEVQIKAIMQGYPYDICSKEIKLAPDFISFYHKVLNYQDKKYITVPR